MCVTHNPLPFSFLGLSYTAGGGKKSPLPMAHFISVVFPPYEARLRDQPTRTAQLRTRDPALLPDFRESRRR